MEATVYRAGTEYRNERDRRSACLRALIDDHASLNAHIVLDEDETMVRFDNQKLIEYTRAARLPRHTALRAHKRSHTDALLARPDAIAWCWAKGGEWRKLIQPAITATREV